MQKTLPGWAFRALSFIGVVLVGSMLLRWVDLGAVTVSGLGLAWNANHWLFLVPISGGLLVAAAASRSPHTRLAAVFAGVVVTGYVLFSIAHSMIHSSLDTWLILGGAGAMIAGARGDRSAWRGIGGAAVLVGFFAPWAELSMFKALTSAPMPLTVKVLWLLPLAGLAGLAATTSKRGALLSAGAGVTVYGAILLVIAALAHMVFGFGAWAALGASAAALVIGVLARSDDE